MNNLQISRGDQIWLAATSAAVIALILLLMYVPSGPRKQYNNSRAELAQLVGQVSTYEQMKVSEEARLKSQEELMERLAARPANFDLLTFLNKTVEEAAVKDRARISSANRARSASPRVSTVQVTLSNVSLAQVIDVLHRVYSSGHLISVQRLESLRPANTGVGLECSLVFVTLKA